MAQCIVLRTPDREGFTQPLTGDRVVIAFGPSDGNIAFYRGKVEAANLLPIEGIKTDGSFSTHFAISCRSAAHTASFAELVALGAGLTATLESTGKNLVTYLLSKGKSSASEELKEEPKESEASKQNEAPKDEVRVLRVGFDHPDWRHSFKCTSFVEGEGAFSTKEQGCGSILEAARTRLFTKKVSRDSRCVHIICSICGWTNNLGPERYFNFSEPLPNGDPPSDNNRHEYVKD